MMYNVPQMRRFRLFCDDSICQPRPPAELVSWISSALCRDVEELDISLSVARHIMMPLFCSMKLSVLKLWGDFCLKIPSSASLPCLKTLHIGKMTFNHSAMRVFSICSALEELLLSRCVFENVLDISFPILRKLQILQCGGQEPVLNVPSLVCFFYHVSKFTGVLGEIALTSVVEAHIDCRYNSIELLFLSLLLDISGYPLMQSRLFNTLTRYYPHSIILPVWRLILSQTLYCDYYRTF